MRLFWMTSPFRRRFAYALTNLKLGYQLLNYSVTRHSFSTLTQTTPSLQSYATSTRKTHRNICSSQVSALSSQINSPLSAATKPITNNS